MDNDFPLDKISQIIKKKPNPGLLFYKCKIRIPSISLIEIVSI